MKEHSHEIVYYGVVNLMDRGNVVGAVDVWRCRECKQLSCEEKRWGVTELSPIVGFPQLSEGQKWAVLVCLTAAGLTWSLVAAAPDQLIVHSCKADLRCDVRVNRDFSVNEAEDVLGRGMHGLYLIDPNVNEELEIGFPEDFGAQISR